MAVTMTHIARRVNLSPATVSRVLSGKCQNFISAATRQRVLQAASDLGYHPNRLARALVTGRTQVVALWIRNPEAPYYAGILRTLREQAEADGYQMILSGYRDRGDATTPVFAPDHTATATWPVDAVLAADCRRDAEAFLAAQGSNGRRTPLIGLSSDYSPQADYVAFDVECGVRQAAQHLVDIGCRRIAHLSAACSIPSVKGARAEICTRIATAAGRRAEIIIAAEETRAQARKAVVEHIRANGAPDGLFCLNDEMAVGAYRGLRDLGLKIPQDVALVGCDGIEDVEYLDPPLTTIIQPVNEMCCQAWAVLIRRLADPQLPLQQALLQPHLVVRESTQR